MEIILRPDKKITVETNTLKERYIVDTDISSKITKLSQLSDVNDSLKENNSLLIYNSSDNKYVLSSDYFYTFFETLSKNLKSLNYEFVYDTEGNLEKIVYDNDIEKEFVYDANGNLTHIDILQNDIRMRKIFSYIDDSLTNVSYSIII